MVYFLQTAVYAFKVCQIFYISQTFYMLAAGPANSLFIHDQAQTAFKLYCIATNLP